MVNYMRVGIPETQPKSPHITSLRTNPRPKSLDNAMLKDRLAKIRLKNSWGYFCLYYICSHTLGVVFSRRNARVDPQSHIKWTRSGTCERKEKHTQPPARPFLSIPSGPLVFSGYIWLWWCSVLLWSRQLFGLLDVYNQWDYFFGCWLEAGAITVTEIFFSPK